MDDPEPTRTENDPDSGRFCRVVKRLQRAETAKIDNAGGGVDQAHVCVYADRIEPSSLDLLEDIRPQRRHGQSEGVELARTRDALRWILHPCEWGLTVGKSSGLLV